MAGHNQKLEFTVQLRARESLEMWHCLTAPGHAFPAPQMVAQKRLHVVGAERHGAARVVPIDRSAHCLSTGEKDVDRSMGNRVLN